MGARLLVAACAICISQHAARFAQNFETAISAMKFTVLTDAHGATLDDLRATHKSLVTSGSKQLNWILLGAVPDAVKILQRRWSFGRIKIEIQPPTLALSEFAVF